MALQPRNPHSGAFSAVIRKFEPPGSHTPATRLLNVGMDITYIQKILGHKHITTTMIYAPVLDKTVEADYQQAMKQIAGQQMPMSQTPELVTHRPMHQTNDELVKAEQLVS